MEKDNKEKNSKRIRIGPLMQQVLEKQQKNVKEVTYECVEISAYDACEILAKKIIEKKLV